MYRICFYMLVCVCFAGCHSERKTSEELGLRSGNIEAEQITSPVSQSLSEKEQADYFIGTGKGTIEANRTVPVYSRLALLVKESKVKEGNFVKKGDLLFVLDAEEKEDQLRRLKALLQEKELFLREILIGQGYSWEDKASIPAHKMELARIKSGYNSTLIEYEIAVKELEKTHVVAPTSGFISELKTYPHNYANTAEPCCYIVNTDRLNVVFYVLENEIESIKVDRQVTVRPSAYADRVYKAKITRVMPVVDANGMIKVKAELEETKDLLPGMNVIVNL